MDAAFAPTHAVPAEGLASWTVPDPGLPADGRLDAGLVVAVLEETTGWAHVRCSNGWETWVDATLLVPLAPVDADAFTPTHRVGAEPLDARDRPDQAVGPVGHLDPGLPVAEVARWGEWVQVRCANGWEAWVDGRRIVALGGSAAGPPGAPIPAPDAAGTAAPAPAGPVDPAIAALERFAPLVGAGIAILGSFLPWFSAGGFTVSAWDMRVVTLLTHEPTDIGIDTGLVLLLVAIVGVPFLTRRPLPTWAIAALGAVAVLCPVLALLLPDMPGAGVGLWITLVGGLTMLVAPVVTAWRTFGRAR